VWGYQPVAHNHEYEAVVARILEHAHAAAGRVSGPAGFGLIGETHIRHARAHSVQNLLTQGAHNDDVVVDPAGLVVRQCPQDYGDSANLEADLVL